MGIGLLAVGLERTHTFHAPWKNDTQHKQSWLFYLNTIMALMYMPMAIMLLTPGWKLWFWSFHFKNAPFAARTPTEFFNNNIACMMLGLSAASLIAPKSRRRHRRLLGPPPPLLRLRHGRCRPARRGEQQARLGLLDGELPPLLHPLRRRLQARRRLRPHRRHLRLARGLDRSALEDPHLHVVRWLRRQLSGASARRTA